MVGNTSILVHKESASDCSCGMSVSKKWFDAGTVLTHHFALWIAEKIQFQSVFASKIQMAFNAVRSYPEHTGVQLPEL